MIESTISYKEYSVKEILLYCLFVFLNLITHETKLALLVSIPQILFVIGLLILNRTEKAFFYHLIFTITCLAIPFSQITNPGESLYGLYNYSKLKIIGPLGYYHLVNFAIFLIALKRKLKVEKKSLFFSLIKVLFFLGATGIVFGIIGLLFFDYYLNHFVSYSVYILIILINAILLAKFHSEKFLNRIFRGIIAVLIASPIASIILKLIGKTMLYGNTSIPILNEVAYYSIFLIFAIYQFRNYVFPLIAVGISILLLIDGGMGGKGIIINALTVFVFLISAFMPYYRKNYKKRTNLVKAILFPCLLVFIVQIQSFFSNSENKLFIYKFESFILMFKAFKGLEYIDVIPASPRVRIISLINIFHDQIRNPIKLLFGSGYGAYFHDHYNLFEGMDLRSGFRKEEVLAGRYGRPHDTLVAVPLANGFFGLFLLLGVVYGYILRIKYNFLAFAVVPWLLLAFYFNSQFGVVGLIMLYASQKRLSLFKENA